MGNMEAELKAWLKKRPYLGEVAGLQRIVTVAAEQNTAPETGAVDAGGAQLVEEVEKGIPVLRAIELDRAVLEFAANLFTKIIDALAAASLTEKIDDYARMMQDIIEKEPALPEQIISEVLEKNSIEKSREALKGTDGGFAVFVAWNALSRALQPLQAQVAELLEEHLWRRGYCPVCGHLPAVAHLLRTDKGRERDLVCGCCRMKWRYKRIGCPYCGNSTQKQLKIIGLDDEPELRIDTCDQCKSYLKTYIGEGNEKIALADWSTLHLDLIAKKRGFERTGYQMYGV